MFERRSDVERLEMILELRHIDGVRGSFRLEPKVGRIGVRSIRNGIDTGDLVLKGDQGKIGFVSECLEDVFC